MTLPTLPSPALPALPEDLAAARPETAGTPNPGGATVSAIVLNRDGADDLERLFRSLAAADTAALAELIVVDHGSSDASRRLIDAWGSRLPIVPVLRDQNHSFSWSNNRAAERARGEYLLLLNNDVCVNRDTIPSLLTAARATGGLVGAGQLRAHPDGRVQGWHHIGIRFHWHRRRQGLVPKEARPTPADTQRQGLAAAMPAVTGAVLMLPRQLYLDLGGLHEGFDYGYEDVDFCLRASLARNRPVLSLNADPVLHRDGGTRRRSIRVDRSGRLRSNWAAFTARWQPCLWPWWRRAALADPALMLGGAPELDVLGNGPRPATGFEALPPAPDGRRSGQIRIFLRPPRWSETRLPQDPLLADVALIRADMLRAWLDSDTLPGFDAVLASDAQTHARVAEAGTPNPCVGDAGDVAAAIARLGQQPVRRVALQVTGYASLAAARDCARQLARHGIAAKLQRSAQVSRRPWGDLVVPGPDGKRDGPAPHAALIARVECAAASLVPPRPDPALPDLKGAPFP